MAVAFKEKVTLQTALCILLALCGIGLLYRNGDGSTLNLTGTIMVFASALSYALYIVGINRTVLKNVATLKVTFYILLSGLTLFFVRLDFGEHITVPDQWYLWGNLLALAIFPTAISFLCTTGAIQYIGSGRHPHHRRRQHNDLHDTLSETVPETPDPKTVTSLRSRAFLSVPVRHGPRATCAFTRGLIDARIPERCSRLLKRPISRRIFRPTAWQAITDKRMSR